MLQAGEPLPDREPAPEGAGSHDARLAAFEQALAEVAARVDAARSEADGWLERTRAGLYELLRFCDERPGPARALVVDSIAWGPAVLRRRGQLLEALADALDAGFAEHDPAGAVSRADRHDESPRTAGERPGEPPPGTAEDLVGACVSLVHTRLLREEGSCLELGPALLSTIVHAYRGPEAARRELDRPHTYLGAETDRRERKRSLAAVRGRSY